MARLITEFTDVEISGFATTANAALLDEGHYVLELLHLADQEANTASIPNIPALSAMATILQEEDLGDDGIEDNTLFLSSGDAIIPGVFFDASAEVFGSEGIADIQIQNELGVQAIALGNHEFDLGTEVLAGLIDGSAEGDFSALSGTDLDGLDFEGASFPYLSANLDFSTDPDLAPLEAEGGQPLDEALNNTVTSSTVADVNGEAIAIIGATVPTIGSISSPGDDLGIFPEDFDSTPTDAQLDALAAIIQAEVDAVLAANEGLDKVILLSHMQQITIEQSLAERLEGVDIIVAGGSNTRLFDDEDRARAGDSVQGEYPGFFTGADGAPVAVVNTDGNYKYLGRLVVEFDENGEIIPESYDEDVSGAFATDAGGLIELADGFGGRVIQFGRLEERQEVGDDPGALPPNTVANARYRVTEFDPETNVVTIEGRYKRLTSPLETVGATDSEGNPPSAIHLHAGGRGENGPIVRNFDVSPSNARSGTFSGTFELTEAEALALATGEYYINLHTEDFPAGELRGQIEFDVLDGASTIGETVDPEIRAIVDAVEAQIVATESNVFGVSDVFLNANRSGTFTADDPDGVRTQETNLGNLTADANLDYAKDFDETVVVSIKNGGGIRANIGEIVVPAGGTEAVRLPNEEIVDGDGNVVKPEGGISQTDIATTLAFNNGLSLVDMTRAELVATLEGGVSALPGVDGGFPQVSGVKFSFDESRPGGDRIVSAGIFDENDALVAELVRDGELVGDPNETFRVVTLNFLLDFGDPILEQLNNLSNPNRFDLTDLDGDGEDDDTFTGAATFAEDGTEQDALAEYLDENFNPDNGGTAFAEADTGPAEDERIQNLAFRDDTVFDDSTGGGGGDGVFTLELLHLADQEANAASIDNIDNLSAVLNALRDEDLGDDGEVDNTLTLSSGDAIIPGLFFDASAAVFGAAGIADIQIQNELGVQAIALGNHEFDLGTRFLSELITGQDVTDDSDPDDGFVDTVPQAIGTFDGVAELVGTDLEGLEFTGADFPYLSANLGFDTDPFLAPLEVDGGQPLDEALANTVTSSTVAELNGEPIGIVGATVPTIDSISSAGDDLGIFPTDFDPNPTPEQLDALAAIIQAEVDALLAANEGLNKVILLSHMQQITIEQELAARLTDVDIIVAGGSNTRLFDEDDRPRDGDSVQGEYPIFIEDAGGAQTAVVNTDGTYKYLGRLVIDFDENGEIIPESYDAAVSGAYATDDQGVADLGAEGLVDPEIDAITDAIQAQIVATESNVFGVSDVFLNGNRSGTFTPDDPDGVRTQETNLGNLTADANLVYTNEIIAAQSLGDPVVVSIKNGGGIRANIGEIVVPAGGTEAVRVPNSPVLDENGVEVKPEGGISQNDIATVLAFNNGLSVLDITRAELVSFLEGSVAALPGVSGGFPQISGLKFSFDQTQTAQTYDENDAVETPGERVQNAGIFDENDVLVAELVRDGELVGDPNETFRIVTLDFLANGGDEILSSIPDDRQLDLVDIDGNGIDDGDLTGAATFSQDGSEQDALAEYLNDNFNPDNGGTAFAEADTGPATDERIQNLIFREDTVLPPVATNTFEGVLLNEVLGSTTSDDAEYVEITGLAGTSLEGLSLIVVEADNGDTNGQVDRLLDFGAEDVIGDNGFFLLASPTGSATYGVVGDADIPDNFIENSAYTIALVETGTLALGATVDGTETFVDAVSVTDNPVGDNTFVIPAPVVGPDGNFLPAGFVRQTVGVDSDEFEILDFGNDPAVNTPTPASFSDLEITAALNIGPDVLLGAEIVDHDPINQELYVTSDDGVQVISVDPATLGNVLGLINPTVDGASDSAITTVATKNGIIAMGVPGADEQADGQVFFYESGTLNFLGAVTVGPLPDSLAFNDAGTHVVVANEGESAGGENEPAADPNPEGSVSVIALNLADVSASTVTTIGFDAFTDEALEAAGIRINPAAPSAQADLEPEFVAIDGNTALISIQENNALAVIEDVTNFTGFTDLLTAGAVDFSQNAGLDPTNDDEAIRIDNFDIFGLRMPDAIDVVEIGGATYYVTANEGDGRGDDPFVDGGDIARGEDLLALNIDGTEAMGVGTLVDPALLASVAATINGVDVTFEEALGDDLILGRLEFSVIDGDTDGDGDLDELFAFGGRSFTIFDESGNVVFDSGSDFEELTAVLDPSRFNADDDDDDQGNLIREFDNRSDDAGPEPEGVVTGQIGDKTYAFIGLERSSGVMVYDITDPTAPVFQEYLLPDDNPDGVENFNPEGLKFVSEADSPLGVPLLLVSYEVSNNIVVYTLEPAADDTQTLSISEIQGSSDFSALGETPVLGVDDISPFDGQEVTTTGIVTAVFQGEDSLGGFYIQSPTDDGDPLTSEGIFVASTDPVVEGDAVTVTGTVTEVDGETRVVASGVSITSSGNALPEAVTINLGVGEVDVALDTDGDYVANLEQYEGMLVTIDEPLSITELFQLDRFGTARLSSEGRLEQFTENNAPDQAGFDQHLQDVAARSIVIDDGRTDQNPDPLLAPTGQGEDVTADAGFRMGDTLDQVTGVLSYSEDPTGSEEPEFRIHQPTAEFTVENPRPEEPEDVGGTLKVAAFNVLNFFTTLDTFPGDEGVGSDQSQDPRGADTNPQNARDGVGPLDEFERQLDKLVAAIVAIDADVLGLVEIENDFLLGGLSPTDQSAVGDRDIAIQELVAAINAVAGEGTYEAVLPDGEFVGTDAISTGIIYKPAAATPVGETAVLVFEEATSDATQLVADAVAPGEVGDFPRNRPAVAATFEDAEGGQVTVAVNHFKSKGDSGLEDAIEVGEAAVAAGTLDQGVLDALLADPNVDQNDGAGFWNAVRTEAAAELAAWLETNPTGVETENQLIVGDLNSYPEETPITTLEAAGFVNTVEAIGDDTPTFVFDGQNGTLDYALASAALIDDVTGATVFATNADEADVFDYNLEFGRDPALFTADQFRASDHDPVIVGLDLGGDGGTGGGGENEIVGTPGSEVVAGTDADETFIEFATGSDRDVLTLGAGADTVIYDGQFDDGVRGTLRIADFTVGEDTISGLTLDDINSSRVIGGATDAADTLILRLGDDGDRLFVRGADEISDLFGMV